MSEDSSEENEPSVETYVRRLLPHLPGPIRHRSQNALNLFETAFTLLDKHRELASFSAITGEEEAATALIQAIRLRKYENAERMRRWDHHHKAALIACVMAVHQELLPILKEFRLTFDFEKIRIDIKLPLSNFGVEGGGMFDIQPTEPLEMITTKNGLAESELYSGTLGKIAADARFENIKAYVAAQANARNTILYASDTALPASQATSAGIKARKSRALALIVLCVMIWQTERKMPMVKQTLLAFLQIISKVDSAK